MDPWNAGLDVGHPSMDAEHRDLYGHTARAAELLELTDPAGVTEAMAALYAASGVHFEHEEGLMLESAYPELAMHQAAHQAFMADFRLLREELRVRGLSPLFRLWFTTRFQDWLRYHIRGLDVQFYRHHRHWQAGEAAGAEARLAAEAAPSAPAGRQAQGG